MFLKLGIIGSGSIFSTHYKSYAYNKYVAPFGIYDRSRARAQQWVNKFKEELGWILDDAQDEGETEMVERTQFALDNLRAYDTAHELLDAADIFDICTPPSHHMPYAIMALERGKCAMNEKPPGLNYIETKKLLEVAANSAGKYQLNENWYWQPHVRLTGQLVHEGKIGTPTKVTVALGHTGPSWGYLGFFYDPFKNGGGCLTDMGPHSHAWAIGLIGEKITLDKIQCTSLTTGNLPERQIQDANGANVWKYTKYPFEDDSEDTFWGTTASGTPIEFHVHTSWAGIFQSAVIEGTEGKITYMNPGAGVPYIQFEGTDGSTEDIKPPPVEVGPEMIADTYSAECWGFTKMAVEGGDSPCGPAECHQLQTLITGTYLSNRRGGEPVTIDDIDAYCQTFIDAYPAWIVRDELIADLMSPFLADFYTSGMSTNDLLAGYDEDKPSV
ncbi:MAG TPA: Gfo/Idh/MocA family oxidoreductase [Candidatus Lokiarchaeia archaeon]|nr:Gfo/Idh/MocA family oxidoreductase [Candidatus Lokiarchaeia archaeon]